MSIIQAGQDKIPEAMESASPGDIVEFTGTHHVNRKITGIKGTRQAPIVLRGTDRDSSIIVGGNKAVAIRFEDCEHVRFGNCTVKDCQASQARGVQAFTSNHMVFFCLTTRNISLDHIHTAGSNDVTVRGLQADGRHGHMAGGKGPHAVYFSVLGDGEEDVEEFLIRDCRAENMVGAAYQANGEGGRARKLTVERVEAIDGQSMGFNFEAVEDVSLQDVQIRTSEDTDGIHIFSSPAEALRLERVAIDVPGDAVVADDGVVIGEPGGFPTPPMLEPCPGEPQP